MFGYPLVGNSIAKTSDFYRMAAANGSSDLYSEMEVDAFRRLFPLRYHEQHLLKSVRPDARKLGSARATTLALGLSNHHFNSLVVIYYLLSGVVQIYICIFTAGAVASADGSALAKIGSTVSVSFVSIASLMYKSFHFSLELLLS